MNDRWMSKISKCKDIIIIINTWIDKREDQRIEEDTIKRRTKRVESMDKNNSLADKIWIRKIIVRIYAFEKKKYDEYKG